MRKSSEIFFISEFFASYKSSVALCLSACISASAVFKSSDLTGCTVFHDRSLYFISAKTCLYIHRCFFVVKLQIVAPSGKKYQTVLRQECICIHIKKHLSQNSRSICNDISSLSYYSGNRTAIRIRSLRLPSSFLISSFRRASRRKPAFSFKTAL